MWLTGFDARRCTMYVDKPWAWFDAGNRSRQPGIRKPGGDCLTILVWLITRQALANTLPKAHRQAAIDQEQAVAIGEKTNLFDFSILIKMDSHPCRAWKTPAQEHIFAQEDENRLLSRDRTIAGFCIVSPIQNHAIRDIQLLSGGSSRIKPPVIAAVSVETMDHVGRSSPALSLGRSHRYHRCRQRNPIFILSMNSAALGASQHNCLTIEEIIERRNQIAFTENLVQLDLPNAGTHYSRYQTAIESQVRRIDFVAKRSVKRTSVEELHLTEDEVAFYDALEVNDSAL